jgi:hypothetical protein
MEGTNCLYNLKNYLQIYLIVDEDKKQLIDIVDRTKGFIPLHIYHEKSTRDDINGNPNKPRGDAFLVCMNRIKISIK